MNPCLSSNKGKCFGDHMSVQFVINMDKLNGIRRKVTYTKYHRMNIKEFMENLQSFQHLSKCEGSVDEPVEAHKKGAPNIINRHAPSCFKVISLRTETDNLRYGKKIWRNADRT